MRRKACGRGKRWIACYALSFIEGINSSNRATASKSAGARTEAKRLRALEDENAKLKRLLADAMLDNASLKGLLSKRLCA
jgi:hypothetical protein